MSHGDSPDGWSTVPLDSCAEVLDARREPVNSKERAKRLGDIPYYGATGQVGWIDDYLFDEELLLVGEDGAPFFDKTKPIAYVIDGKSWVNNHAHVLRARQGVVTNKYLKYFLDSFDFTDYVGGSTRDKLTQGSMKSIPVPLAPLAVQEEVVRVLDQCAELTDEAKTHLSRAEYAGERFRQAVLTKACTGSLTAEWRDANPAAETAEHYVAQLGHDRRERLGRRYKPPATPTPVEELPSGWANTTVGALVDVATGATPLRRRSDFWGGTVPWVTSGAVNAGLIEEPSELITELALRETNAKLFPVGSLLVAMYGEGQTRGRVAELGIQAATNQAVAALVFDDRSSVLRPYLRLFFEENYERIRRKAFGGVQPNLSLGLIRSIAVMLPPVDEQTEIVRRVSELLSFADSVVSRIRSAEQTLNGTSNAVLANTLRGEITSFASNTPLTAATAGVSDE